MVHRRQMNKRSRRFSGLKQTLQYAMCTLHFRTIVVPLNSKTSHMQHVPSARKYLKSYVIWKDTTYVYMSVNTWKNKLGGLESESTDSFCM